MYTNPDISGIMANIIVNMHLLCTFLIVPINEKAIAINTEIINEIKILVPLSEVKEAKDLVDELIAT